MSRKSALEILREALLLAEDEIDAWLWEAKTRPEWAKDFDMVATRKALKAVRRAKREVFE